MAPITVTKFDETGSLPGSDCSRRESDQLLLQQAPSTPSVVAAIVNYNGGDYLKNCIRSLLAQTRIPTRILVVDNASSDNSFSSIANEPHCDFMPLAQNTGFSAACNYAAKHAEPSEWLLLLNPDAVLAPDWLERMLEASEKHKDVAMLASRLLQHDRQDLLDGAGDIFHVSGAHWRRGHGHLARNQYMTADDVFSPCAAAALYRRNVFVEAGGFDESFFCYGEDIDLAFRARMLGYRCLYVPTAIAYHAGSASSGRRSDFSIYFGHRNLVWVYFKNMPMILMWIYLPQHLLWNVVTIIWFILRGQGKTILRAKWDAIKGLPRVFRQRHEIQVQRRVQLRTLWSAMDRGLFWAYLRRR